MLSTVMGPFVARRGIRRLGTWQTIDWTSIDRHLTEHHWRNDSQKRTRCIKIGNWGEILLCSKFYGRWFFIWRKITVKHLNSKRGLAIAWKGFPRKLKAVTQTTLAFILFIYLFLGGYCGRGFTKNFGEVKHFSIKKIAEGINATKRIETVMSYKLYPLDS